MVLAPRTKPPLHRGRTRGAGAARRRRAGARGLPVVRAGRAGGGLQRDVGFSVGPLGVDLRRGRGRRPPRQRRPSGPPRRDRRRPAQRLLLRRDQTARSATATWRWPKEGRARNPAFCRAFGRGHHARRGEARRRALWPEHARLLDPAARLAPGPRRPTFSRRRRGRRARRRLAQRRQGCTFESRRAGAPRARENRAAAKRACKSSKPASLREKKKWLRVGEQVWLLASEK